MQPDSASPGARKFGDRMLSRREWMAVACALAAPSPTQADDAQADESTQIRAIEALARKAGLDGFRVSRSNHFLGVGNAPDAYRAEALKVCEAFARAFVPSFHDRGFDVSLPAKRLTLVILKDAESYQAVDPSADPSVGGHYAIDSNRLVVYDFRSSRDQLATEAERVNTFTLIHESAHLLSYNCGLLSRQADVPLALSEGLATFMELWRPRGREKLGATNRPRLKALLDAGDDATAWIPIGDLLARDDHFAVAADRPGQDSTAQLAYAESWLFVHLLLKSQARLPAFRAYLKGLPAEASARARITHATKTLGPLADLDREIKRHARRELAAL